MLSTEKFQVRQQYVQQTFQQQPPLYITDISLIVLSVDEILQLQSHQNNANKPIGHLLIMLCDRQPYIDFYSTELKKNTEDQTPQLVLLHRLQTPSKGLTCKLVRPSVYEQQQYQATNGKRISVLGICALSEKLILLFDCFTGEQLQSIDLQPDFDVDILTFRIGKSMINLDCTSLTENSQSSQESTYLLQLGDGNRLRLFSLLGERTPVAQSDEIKPRSSLNCIEVLEDWRSGFTFGIGDKMGALQVWEFRVQHAEIKLQRKIISTLLWILTIAPVQSYRQRGCQSCDLVAVGGSFSRLNPNKYSIDLIAWREGVVLKTIVNGHTKWINTLRVLSSAQDDKEAKRYLVSGSADQVLKIWDVFSGQMVKQIDNFGIVVMHAMRTIYLNESERQILGENSNFLTIAGSYDEIQRQNNIKILI